MPHVIAVVVNSEDMQDYDVEPEYEAQVVDGYVHPNVADSVYCINYKEARQVVEAFNGGEYYSLDAALQAVRMEYRTPVQ